MTETADRLAALRAQLSEAEHAVADVPDDADDKVRRAAEKQKADVEKRLAEAHLEAQAAEKPKVIEVREEPKPQPPARRLTLQEMNQSASAQNVRGTENLTPAEHARRRNPKGS